jgi:hypothetical protein
MAGVLDRHQPLGIGGCLQPGASQPPSSTRNRAFEHLERPAEREALAPSLQGWSPVTRALRSR